MDVLPGLALVGWWLRWGWGWVGWSWSWGRRRCSGGRHDSGPGPRLLHLNVGLGVTSAGFVARVRVAALAFQAALGGRS